MRTHSIKTDILKVPTDSETLGLLEKAQEDISDHETTRFNAQDWTLFFAMLDKPPEATERMKKAAKAYHKMINEQ